MTTLLLRVHTVFSEEPHSDSNLTGSWTLIDNANDTFGNPCPSMPRSIEFHLDQTLTTSFGNRQVPFKTTASMAERHKIVRRVPEFRNRNLIIIRPISDAEWDYIPMMYAYTVNKDTLTLTLPNWSPATYIRTVK